MNTTNRTIIHTIGSLSIDKGGPSRSVCNLCNSLADLGNNIALFSLKDRSYSQNRCTPLNANVLVNISDESIFLNSLSLLFYRDLKKFISRQKISIIHDHGLWISNNYISSILSKKNHIPFVLSPRGMLESWSLTQKSYKKRLAFLLYQDAILKQVDMFFATSKEEYQNIRKRGLQQPVAIIPNAVYIPNEKHITPKRKKTDSNYRILFLSRIHKKKGLINLVRAWSKLRTPNWKITIAGNDSDNHQSEVIKEINNLGVNQFFEFVGSVEGKDKEDLFQHSDLFILPSFSENFGIVVAEALSYGIPVITTKATPWSSLITNNCGWWIDSTVDAIAFALQESMSLSRSERFSMGRNGRKLIASEFSWPIIAEQTQQAYNWILGDSSKPAFIKDK
jgi:glycosyltransferase involved in cell wall biosynthesis